MTAVDAPRTGAARHGAAVRPGAWRAMAGNPLRFLISSWPWRALAYLATGPLVAAAWLAAVAVLAAAGVVLTPVVAGVVLLALVPVSAVGYAAVERRRLRWLDPRPAPTPHREPPRPGPRPWLGFRLREAATWRELGYALLSSLLAVVDLAVPFVIIVGSTVSASAPWLVDHGDQLQYGPSVTVDRPPEAWAVAVTAVLLLVAGLYAMTALAAARAALARALLVRAVEEELVEVRASRARMAGAFEAERRRIERDLHDGAQQRLTGLIMTLGLAGLDGADPALIGKGRAEARAALEELRDLVRGIHPSVLTDRGLAAAVASLAERSPVPVEVRADLPARPPESVESAAYFVVAEALANVAKHSGATRARVTLRRAGPALVLEIWDDGAGGADASRGTGLQGLADRVAVHDGSLRLSSPHGGPTIVRVEIPCAS
ncbi:sensor histidine kinase [Actinomadura viridis]|uniref:histidine kinase n=1 Tax=Actinomadura viridis TaxID=58110 RepID=A0A931DII4_9ACTN|nr:sensor histidine kinase [Actinomadura viridis]MBG6087353.1 signal transduction histidine kinase [Actinomadura viridis]